MVRSYRLAKTAEIAVSVEAEPLDPLELFRERTGESLSAAVTRAIRLLTSEERRARLITRTSASTARCRRREALRFALGLD